IRFRFSIMDPALTYSLPLRHTLAGAFDAVTHIMEHYFNGTSGFDLQNRMCEGVMRSIIENMKAIIKNPKDYETRAQLMMGATLANSTLLGLGCNSDWASHYMENPVTTFTHVLHGEGLAVIVPAWMRYTYKKDIQKAVRFALEVMKVENSGSSEEIALRGINALEDFIGEIGLPKTLKELGVKEEDYETLANNSIITCGQPEVGGISKLKKDDVIKIYKLAGTDVGSRRK
ncbi:MAG: iron-containing alcohol dehydrogenase, partial [Sphaerochaetaceae bacterium]|nr:iron-containing alcohol dehydrogenase [Sphaerochaetaceae bacterium]